MTADLLLDSGTTATTPVWTLVDSPIGPLTVVAEGDAITAILFDAHRHPCRPNGSAGNCPGRPRAPC